MSWRRQNGKGSNLHPGPFEAAVADDEVSVVLEDDNLPGMPKESVLLSGTSERGQEVSELVENLEIVGKLDFCDNDIVSQGREY